MKKFRFQWGAFLMFFVYGGLFFLLFGRLLFIQVTGEANGQALAALADAKYARESVLTADRGRILDRNGEIIAADTLSYRLVAVLDENLSDENTKRHVEDPDRTAMILAEYLPLEREDLRQRLTRTASDIEEGKKKQVEFGAAGRDISHETALAIREHKLPGIVLLEDKKRFYPNGVFASYLIGFASKVEDENRNVSTVGRMGLEATYNEILTGKDGKVEFEADRWGFTLPRSDKAITPAEHGYDIQLTIDKTIQNFVEDAMNVVEKEYSPSKMMAVVANPKTGAILAMSQRPTFHPDTREGLTTNWLNEAVENTIEPGSTLKMVTLAAAIEEKKWDPFAYYMSGKYTLFGTTIRDHNGGRGWGSISFLEGFQRSSNVSMAYLLERIGDKTFIEYVRKFGFGERTGIDLPNEAAGIVSDEGPVERLTTAYGQGSTVTPIQMIQAATAIANDGTMMKPYVIDKVTNPNTGEIVQNHGPEEKGQPISEETALKVKEALASTITSEVGTGRKFALNGYTLAGKTGTAEIPNPTTGKYFRGASNYLYSFIGMAPAEDPQLIVYVFVQQPKIQAGEVGSDPVAKLFKSITESSLKYMNIVPEGEEIVKTKKLGDYVGEDSGAAAEELEKLGYKVALVGEGGAVVTQSPEQGAKLAEGSVVILKTEGVTTLPDFTGWSKKTVLSFKILSGLDIQMNGDGYVTEQSLSAGTRLAPGEPVVIQLQVPSSVYQPDQERDEELIIGG